LRSPAYPLAWVTEVVLAPSAGAVLDEQGTDDITIGLT
jgi:hypothetical protein